MRSFVTYGLLLFCFSSCVQSGMGYDGGGSGYSGEERNETNVSKLRPAEYVKWVEDEKNGLKKEKTIDDMVYTAQYKPYDYVICEEEKKDALADTTVKRNMKELDGLQYIDLKIALKSAQGELLKYNLSSSGDYSDRVNYFAFGMQKDVQLIEGTDTLPCLLFHYERVYDVAPYATFLLGFQPGKTPLGDKTLQFTDHVFDKGIIKFFFDGRDLKSTPVLQTE